MLLVIEACFRVDLQSAGPAIRGPNFFLEDAAKLDAERAPAVKAWEQALYEKGFWRAPEAIPEALDSKINSDAPATEQLDELEGWLDRQKDHDAGDWPTGEFTGGKHDRHDSSDNLKA